ncbi:MAG TPA: hypothetical protein EYG46_10055 [Myxococcales bacterium]|nr:hypothetical protein [Myxococcales bacterium]HIM01323.1 hypothetical protein [Myxococcales bacterium]
MIRAGKRVLLALLVVSVVDIVGSGCATDIGEDASVRREALESRMRDWGVADAPAVKAKRAELDAAVAHESDSPILDTIEVRATARHEDDEKLKMLVRLPVEDYLGASAERAARRAETEVRLAQLGEVALKHRVRTCVPELEQLVHAERMKNFRSYVKRQQAMLDQNQKLRDAGQLDQIAALRFELVGHVKLARNRPVPPARVLELDPDAKPTIVLPSLRRKNPGLADSLEVVHEQVVRNNPEIDEFRARGKEFNARAQKKSVSRYPSVRYLGFGIEPVAYPGDKRQIEAQVAFNIPFGRGANAGARRYRSLALGQENAERAFVQRRVQETRAALEEINHFRSQSGHWRDLLARADKAEKAADRWWKKRLAGPKAISQLVDEVFDARSTVVDAQERAGYATCAVLSRTGLTVDEWPQ